MKKYIYLIAFFVIITLASVLRIYKLDKVAPSISWDEAAVGYNAYTIAHWAKDEWGKTLPITFKSFGDDKNPVHVYATVPFVGLFGLNEFNTRISAAMFGIGNVILLFFLARYLLKSNLAGLIAAFVLAISPYNIQFSRFNHELNFAVFFFLLGLVFFFRGLKNSKFLVFTFLSFGIDLLTYQSAKIVTPPLVFLLVFLYFRDFWKHKKQFLAGIIIYALFISLLFIKPELLGGARLQQNAITLKEVTSTMVYQKTNNYYLGLASVVGSRYKKYFGNQFLFETGDPIPRHSAQIVGTFYKVDKLFLVFGLIFILYKLIIKREKIFLFILIWCLIAPLPAAASSIFTHSARAMFMTGSWHLIIALGVFGIYQLIKNKLLQSVFLVTVVILMSLSLFKYVKYYFSDYVLKYAIEWQYGMKDVVSFVSKNPQYYSVYMTDAFSQPYIFFLYYLKTPLPELLRTVKYNQTQSRPSNLVISFGRYHFGMWDQIESYPNPDVLYIVNPSKYDGLRYKNQFGVMNLIKYPNGTDAFYIVN